MKVVLLTLGITLGLSCSVLAADPQCHTNEVMKCVDIVVDWLHTLPKQSVPTTEEEVDYECQEWGKAIDCALKYRDSCMTPLQKEAVGLLIDGIFEYRDSFCKPDSPLRARWMSHSNCLNKLTNTEEMKEQIVYILAVVEKMVSQDDSNKIMYACCGYRKIHGHLLKMGTDSCGPDAMDMVLDFINMFLAQLPDVLCNNMNGTEDHCAKLLPPDGTKPSNTLKSTALYAFLKDAVGTWVDLPE